MKEKVRARTRPKQAARTTLRISVVRYLNTAPLVWGLDRGQQRNRYRLSFVVPAVCADDLSHGRADVGIIPSIAYQHIPHLQVVPGISVASERKVESVLLVSRGPVRKVKRVALDTSSRTSVALTKILFARHWRREPEYRDAAPDLKTMLSQADAALVIGDPALQFLLGRHEPEQRAAEREENLHIYDLVEEWNRLTNLPFVFAFWAVRADSLRSPQERRRLVQEFERAREQGLQHLPEIAHKAGEELKLPGGQLERYLRYSIDYRLDAPHIAGLEYFYRAASELGLIGKVRPLEFL